MVRLLLRVAVFLGSAAIGLVVAAWVGATVVWLVTALATVVLGKLVVPAKAQR